MTQVKLNPQEGDLPTPSQQIVQAANETFTTTDALGRVITLKKPGVLAQFDLIEALGELSKNDVYRVMCLPVIYVQAIDGSPTPAPNNRAQMRALINRLGEEGFAAIRAATNARYPQENEDEGEGEAAVKK